MSSVKPAPSNSPNKSILIIFGFIIVLSLTCVYLLLHSKPDSDSNYYNSDNTQIDGLRLTDEAIKQKDKNICDKVISTIRPGARDEDVVIKGQEAIDWCKLQVEQGGKIIGG